MVQANIVATKYAVPALSLTPACHRHTAWSADVRPRRAQQVTETFTNTTGARALGVTLSLGLPSRQWKAVVTGSRNSFKTFASVAPGASVSATFTVTAGPVAFDGDLDGKALWLNPDAARAADGQHVEKVRDVSPSRSTSSAISTPGNATDSFIELYNAGTRTVDLSGWTLDEHAIQQADLLDHHHPGRHQARGRRPLPARASHARASPPRRVRATARSTSAARPVSSRATRCRSAPGAPPRPVPSPPSTTPAPPGPRVPGKIGNAVQLSGNGDYVALPSGIVSSLHDFTISAWVNPSADTTWSRIFDFGNGTTPYMFLSVDGGGAGLRFAITTGSNGAEQQLTGGGQLPLNTWSHVAVTLSGTTGRSTSTAPWWRPTRT